MCVCDVHPPTIVTRRRRGKKLDLLVHKYYIHIGTHNLHIILITLYVGANSFVLRPHGHGYIIYTYICVQLVKLII